MQLADQLGGLDVDRVLVLEFMLFQAADNRTAAPGNKCWVWAMLPVSLVTVGDGAGLGELINFGRIINPLGRRNR